MNKNIEISGYKYHCLVLDKHTDKELVYSYIIAF